MYPAKGDAASKPYLIRSDVGFNKDKQVESYFLTTFIPGAMLPSEQALLPVHLRDKSLSELAEHYCLLFNRPPSSPGVREEHVAMHAPKVTFSTANNVLHNTAEEFMETLEKTYAGFDPTQGELYATNGDGKLRADIAELVPGKLVRATIVVGAEMVRLYPMSGEPGEAYIVRIDFGFDGNKKIESCFTAKHIPGATLPSEQALLPVNLRDKSLPDLVRHMFQLENEPIGKPGVLEQKIAMHAPQIQHTTLSGDYNWSPEEYYETLHSTNAGYDKTRGDLWATNEDGTVRLDVEEVVPGKFVKVTMVAGSEMVRCVCPGSRCLRHLMVV